jgi:type IV pilus assembly protein PilE
MKVHQKNNIGFTILELVVVIAIIGILGAIGVPAYQGYVTKAKETKAQNSLQSIYMMEKNFFSQNYCYYKSASASDDTININEQLFGSPTATASIGPIEVGSKNDYYFYVSGTPFVCDGSSCTCTTANASDFTIYAVNRATPSKIFSINHQNIKTGF